MCSDVAPNHSGGVTQPLSIHLQSPSLTKSVWTSNRPKKKKERIPYFDQIWKKYEDFLKGNEWITFSEALNAVTTRTISLLIMDMETCKLTDISKKEDTIVCSWQKWIQVGIKHHNEVHQKVQWGRTKLPKPTMTARWCRGGDLRWIPFTLCPSEFSTETKCSCSSNNNNGSWMNNNLFFIWRWRNIPHLGSPHEKEEGWMKKNRRRISEKRKGMDEAGWNRTSNKPRPNSPALPTRNRDVTTFRRFSLWGPVWEQLRTVWLVTMVGDYYLPIAGSTSWKRGRVDEKEEQEKNVKKKEKKASESVKRCQVVFRLQSSVKNV